MLGSLIISVFWELIFSVTLRHGDFSTVIVWTFWVHKLPFLWKSVIILPVRLKKKRIDPDKDFMRKVLLIRQNIFFQTFLPCARAKLRPFVHRRFLSNSTSDRRWFFYCRFHFYCRFQFYCRFLVVLLPIAVERFPWFYCRGSRTVVVILLPRQ